MWTTGPAEREGMGLVRRFRTKHNIYLDAQQGSSTDVYESESALVVGVIHAADHNNVGIQRVVQPSVRGPHPADPDRHGAPAGLELLPAYVTDRLGPVEDAAVTEVEPRVHNCFGRPHALFPMVAP